MRPDAEGVPYSSYKAPLKGSIRRPPRRAVVLAIADYLECTLAERNRLLVAPQYAPQQPYLSGVALTARLGPATSVRFGDAAHPIARRGKDRMTVGPVNL